MKAQNAVRDFNVSLRECANFAKKGITHICKNIGDGSVFGGRGCGTPEERKAQEYMADQMRKYADEVKIEDFKVAPWAFMGWVLVDVILALCGTLIYWLPQIPYNKFIAFGLFCLALLFAIMEFLFYKQFLDVFCPKKTSCNAVGIYKPEGEVKQRIIFSGHADSSQEWRFSHWGGPPALLGGIIGAFSGFVVNLVAGILFIANHFAGEPFLSDDVQKYMVWGLTAWVPLYCVCFFFCTWGKYVQGANDNLTGCYGAICVLKFLKDNDIRFKHTEVVALTTGGEECGLRGAKAYSKAHNKECKEIDTVFVGLETFRDYDHFAIYKRDMTNTTANSPIACAILKEGAKRAGRDLPYENVFFGSSDAAAVSQAGIHATCLAGMDPAPPRYYHTRGDTYKNLCFNSLENGIEIAIQTAFVFDEVGLKEPQ
ncbi:MAG: M28 family metallopeptidase [Oscillospiraceae bacterium]|nr:M28 family metallopeptidase [Oscillospiraceae bacterium]